MSGTQSKGNGSGFNFKPVVTSVPVAGGALRGDQSIVVKRTGYAAFNAEGSGKWDHLVIKKGLNPDQIHARFEADDEAGVVAVIPCDKAMPGCVLVRGDQTNRVIHLGGTFKDYPKLRPTGTRECVVSLEPDEENPQYLLIAVSTGVVKPTANRKKPNAQTQSSAQAAPTAETQPGFNPQQPAR